MKKLIAILLLCCLVGCTSSTEYGQCVGAFDEKDQKLVYKLDVWNVALGIIFFEIVAPPVIVLANETFCPRGRKP